MNISCFIIIIYTDNNDNDNNEDDCNSYKNSYKNGNVYIVVLIKTTSTIVKIIHALYTK